MDRITPVRSNLMAEVLQQWITSIEAANEFALRPGISALFHRNVAILCFIHGSEHESRLNPIETSGFFEGGKRCIGEKILIEGSQD